MKLKALIVALIGVAVFLLSTTIYAANGDLIVNGDLSIGSSIKFPDNTIQKSAAPGNALVWDVTIVASGGDGVKTINGPVTFLSTPILDANSDGGYTIEAFIDTPVPARYVAPSVYIDNGSGGWYSNNGDYYCAMQYSGSSSSGTVYSAPLLTVIATSGALPTYSMVHADLDFNAIGNGNWAIHYRSLQWLGATRSAPTLIFTTMGDIFMPNRTVSNIKSLQFQVLYGGVSPSTVLTNGIGVNSRFRIWKKK